MLISFFTQKLKIYCVYYYAKESVINGNECFGNCLVHHFTGGNAYGMDDDTIPSPEVSSFLLLMHNLNWFLLLPADGYYYSWWVNALACKMCLVRHEYYAHPKFRLTFCPIA